MKKRIVKVLITLAASSMIMGTAALVSAEDNTSSLFSLEGLKGLAEEVWAEVPDEDKAALMNGVQDTILELVKDEEIQNLMSELPEEQLDMVMSLVTKYLMGVADDGAGEPLGNMEALTHDELLEKTGIDFPVVDEADDEDQYILFTINDVTLANKYIMSEDMIISLVVTSNVAEISEVAPYIQALQINEPTETTYRDQTAYFAADETNTVLAWIEEDNTFYGVSTMVMDTENTVDEAAIKAFADKYFPE